MGLKRAGVLLFVFLIAPFYSVLSAQQVYVGIADQWEDLATYPGQWTYVQRNADGFYVNFIMMNRVNREAGKIQEVLNSTCHMFASHRAYLESDIRSPKPGQTGFGGEGPNEGASEDQDQLYIRMLHAAGCTIPYTSLNSGWSPERAANLKTYELQRDEPVRLNFVQIGPWNIAGDINRDATVAIAPNASFRTWIIQSDGMSTDGPLGYWMVDYTNDRSGSLSLVKFAHQHGKRAVVMLCPYGALVPSYSVSEFLATAEDKVRQHEDATALPDIWSVFEYATSIPAVPEQVNGQPADTTTGLAYWLLHHIHDPEHWASLSMEDDSSKVGRGPSMMRFPISFSSSDLRQSVKLKLQNTSAWLDLAPVLHMKIENPAHDLSVKLTLNDKDVTSAASAPDGLNFIGGLRLFPGSLDHLQLLVSRVHPSATPSDANSFIKLELIPNASVPKEVHQSIVLPILMGQS